MRWPLTMLVLASAFFSGCMQPGKLREPCGLASPIEPTQRPAAAMAPTAFVKTIGYEQSPEPREAESGELEAPTPAEEIESPRELPPPVLELWELEEMALASNPAIAVARSRMNAAYGRWIQVGLPPNPIIGYSGQQLGSNGEAEQNGVLIGQEFITGKKLKLDRQVVAQEVARAEQELATKQTRVITDVRINFYELVVAQRQVELARQLVDVGERGVKAAEALVAAKEASRLDTLQLSVERDTARLLLSNAEYRRDAAWRQLVASVGQPNLPMSQVSDELNSGPAIEWDHALERLKTQSPEVASAMTNISRARWALNRAEAEAVPDVTVEGVIQHDNSTGSSNGNLQVTMPVPIWNRNQGGVHQAWGELSAAEQDLGRIELRLERQLAAVYERYVSALEQVRQYEQEILPAANESLELVTRGYQAGEFDYLRLLTAQRTYFQTNGTYLDALRQWKTAETEIEGLLLQGALEDSEPRN